MRQVTPRIELRASQEDGMVGIGIDEHYHQEIFGMFTWFHSREDHSSAGMGLAICKKIVERHGGKIGIRSVSGEESTFLVTLPKRRRKKRVFRGFSKTYQGR